MSYQASNEFGLYLFKEIVKKNKVNNFISPFSISTALGMVHLGAKHETIAELRQILGYNKYNIDDLETHNLNKILIEQIKCANSSSFVLNIANRVLLNKNFNVIPNYINLLDTNYDAFLQEVDKSDNYVENSIKMVNEWVSQKTNENITSIIDKTVLKDTKLVILNAIYFKGIWKKQFNPDEEKKCVFFNNGHTNVIVNMMVKRKTSFKIAQSKELQADILEIPFIGGDMIMFILLPHRINGLENTALVVTEEILSNTLKSLRPFLINLYIPKFKVEKTYNLIDQFKCMGFKNILNDNADLSGITGEQFFDCGQNLYVSEVIHKVVIEIKVEEIKKNLESSQTDIGRVYDFRVDHPFIFIIRDTKNNHNFFYGQIIQL